MKKQYFLWALYLALACALPVFAQNYVQIWNREAEKPVTSSDPLQVTISGGSGGLVGVKGVDGSTISSTTNPVASMTPAVTQANITNVTGNVPNTSTAITLVAASRTVTFGTTTDADTVYVDMANGTATTADFRIDPGASMTWKDLPAITTFKIIGATATGKYRVTAW